MSRVIRTLFCILFICTNLLVNGQVDSTTLFKKTINEEEYWDNIRVSLYADPNYNASSDFQYYISSGIKNIEAKDYAHALSDFKRSLSIINNAKFKQSDSLVRKVPSPYIYIGYTKSLAGEIDSAFYYFRKCIKSNISLSEAYNEIGTLFLNKYELDSALTYFEAAYNKNKKNVVSNYNLGYTFFIKQELDKSRKYFTEVSRINPKFNLSYIMLGQISLLERNISRSNKYFSLAIEVNPNAPSGYYYRGLYYLKINKLELAYQDFSKLYELDTLNYSALSIIGAIDIKEKRFDIGIVRLAKCASVKVDRSKLLQPEDYRDIDLKSLLIEMAVGTLNPEEKEIGHEFIKNILNNDWFINKDITNNYLEKHSDSKFVLRLYLQSLTRTNFKFDVKFCDYYLRKDSTLLMLQYVKSKILYDNGDYSLSAENFTKLIELSKAYEGAYYYRGLAYHNSGKDDLAILDYNTLISYYPYYSLAYNDEGNSFESLNNHKKAIKDYLTAIYIDPYFKYPYNNLSISYRNLNMLDSAIFYASKAIELDNFYFQPYYNRSYAYKEKKEYTYALIDCNKTLQLAPNWLHALSLKIDILMESENYENAIQDINAYIKLYPSFSDKQLRQRAQAYFYINDFEKSIDDFQKLFKKDSTDIDIIISLGDCYQGKKDLITAITFYKKAIKNKPNSLVYYLKGICNYQLDSIKQAKMDFENAIIIDSTYSSAYGYLARIYYNSGYFNKCIYYSQKAIHFNKNALHAMFNIALSNLRLENFNLAKRYYQIYFKLIEKQNNTLCENAINDLKDLIKKGILVNESKEILKDIFNVNADNI